MNTITTTLTTSALFSDDGLNRYLLTKTWDAEKPTLAIIMLSPSEASAVALDNTTMLVLNNAARLGYGAVEILNLFSRVNDFSLQYAGMEDAENLEVIVSAAQKADVVVYAAGVGKAANKKFQERQRQVLEALRPMEKTLHCLSDADGNSRLQHPLSPAVRTWHLSKLEISELIEEPKSQEEPPKKGKAKKEQVS